MQKGEMMREAFVEGKTLAEAYHKSLLALAEKGEVSDCADWNTTQKELGMTIHVEEPLSDPMISRCFIGDPYSLQKYVLEMLDGILDFEVALGNWAYTYHMRYEDQVPFIVNELKRNPSSRRAVMLVRDKEKDMGSADPACLQHIQYFIRKGKLDCMVLFRSNDACKATYMNAYALIRLQEKIARELGVEVGTYTHRASSFHCYEKDFGMLEGYVKRIRKAMEDGDMEEVTFDYEDDWDELMEAEVPGIIADAERMKREAQETKRLNDA